MLAGILILVTTATPPEADFDAQIRPLLARRCLVCHGFDPSTRKSGLRLDDRDEALRGGRGGIPAFMPGEPDTSELVRRVSSRDPDERMPPGDLDPLSAEEQALLRRWIADGAPYTVHWSLRPLQSPAVPTVEADDWARDDVDRFIRARLDDAGLRPAPEADRAALLRRLSFDLIGLPPTPAELEAFVEDPAPDAYERVVDRLLDSPHFGERWGRHWLDLVRYAETHGHEFDYPIRYAWRYRDYVIRALNADVPYDAFITEHLAGDLQDDPRRHEDDGYNESIIATGFWFLSQGTHAPVDSRADEAERIDNQIDVMSKAVLGATVSCARCHDHKFDPITTREYYALYGFLQSSRRQEAFLDPDGRIAAACAALRQSRHDTKMAHDELVRQAGPPEAALIAAAVESRWGTPREDDPAVTGSFVVLEDFEGDDYGAWRATGTAFGPRPYTQDTIAAYQGDIGAHGRGFVNSHNSRSGESVGAADDHTGRLVGPAFTVTHRSLHFLVDGGNHPGRTSVNLVVDGEVVRAATGHDSNAMRAERWDVQEFVGREAHLEIVDEQKGSWGQIGADWFVLSDDDVLVPLPARPIATVANEFGVDPVALERWVTALGAVAEGDPADVRALATGSTASTTEAGDASQLIARFDGEGDSWFASGEAWSIAPGEALVATSHGVEAAAPAIATSRRWGLRTQGVLRSPTFELTDDVLSYRVRGQGPGARIRLIVDGYVLDEFNALLFDGFTFPVESAAWTVHRQPIPRVVGHRAWIELHDEGDGWLEVDWVRLGDAAPAREVHARAADDLARIGDDAIAAWNAGDADREQVELLAWLIRNELIGDASAHDRLRAAVDVERTIEASMPEPMRVLAMQDGTPEDERVFVRGDHRMLGESAPRRFIGAFGGTSVTGASAGSGRLDLARQILDDGNPLVARAAVNRAWHHLFGVGLAATPDDLGALGQTPTHPALLDHLAVWFRTDAEWSTKALIRRLVRTATYRMAVTGADRRAVDIDPANRLLHRARLRRLQGEVIRDAILAVSGRLDRTLEGPPIAIHLTPFMEGRGRPGRSGPLDGDGRRSIYLAVRRNFLSPMMLAFDAPVPHSTVGRRTVSNVPAQSLTMMNDPFVVQQAEYWAERILDDAALGSDIERVDRMYREALGRPPATHELSDILEFLRAADGSERERWADVAHVLFNVKEFIYVQ